MHLQLADFQTGTWRRLAQELHDRIELSRKRNDGDLDPVATAKLRGRIKALQELIALADEARATATSPDKALVIAGGDPHQET